MWREWVGILRSRERTLTLFELFNVGSSFAGAKVMGILWHLAETFLNRSAVSGSKNTSGGDSDGP